MGIERTVWNSLNLAFMKSRCGPAADFGGLDSLEVSGVLPDPRPRPRPRKPGVVVALVPRPWGAGVEGVDSPMPPSGCRSANSLNLCGHPDSLLPSDFGLLSTPLLAFPSLNCCSSPPAPEVLALGVPFVSALDAPRPRPRELKFPRTLPRPRFVVVEVPRPALVEVPPRWPREACAVDIVGRTVDQHWRSLTSY
jgi:hypothetical protein